MLDVHARRPASILRRLPLALALAAGLCLGACGGEDPLDEMVRNASTALNSLSAGGASYPEQAEVRRSKLTAIQSQVRGAQAQNAPPSQQAALALVNARLSASLADLDAQAAADAEARLLARVGEVRALVRRYKAESANAAAAEQFNPADQIAKTQAAITSLRERIKQAETMAGDMDRAIVELKSKSEGLARQASAKRDEAARTRASAQGQSQAAQLTATQQAAAIAREASQLDTQASLLQAELNMREPEFEKQRGVVEALKEESRRAEASVSELQTRQQLARQLAAGARAAASEAAASIAKALGEIEGVRTGELEAATTAAINGYQASAAAARAVPAGSSPDDAGALNLARAIALQGQADTLLIRARGLDALAGVVRYAADAQPAMPDQASLASTADRWQAAAASELEAAKTAMGEAADAYGAIRNPKGPMVKERAEYVGAMLTWIKAGDLKAPRPVLGTPAADPGASPGSTASAPTVAGDSPEQAAVRASIASMLSAAKSNDFAGVFNAIHAETDVERQSLEALRSIATVMKRLDDACKAKFGKPFAQLAREARGGAGPMGAMGNVSSIPGVPGGELNPADFTITMTSPTEARVATSAGGNQTWVRVGDRWMLKLPPEASANPEMAKSMANVMKSLFDQVAGDVESGAISTPEQLLATLRQRMQQMGPGGG